MRNLDAIIIIYSTGEEAENVKAQAEALERRCKARATWVHSFGTTGGGMPNKLSPPSHLPQKPKIGVYIVGHASSAIGSEYASLWDHTMNEAVSLVTGVVSCFNGAVLEKVSLIACNLASGEVQSPPPVNEMPTEATMEAGSYVQQFCGLLAKVGHIPKVAGWDYPIEVITCDSEVSKVEKGEKHDDNLANFAGRKSIASHNFKLDSDQFWKNGRLTTSFKPKYRKNHKFAYQVQNGSVAKLTLDEWHKNP